MPALLSRAARPPRRPGHSGYRSSCLLRPAPASRTIRGDDVLDQGREGRSVKRLAPADGDGPPGRVAVAARDEPLRVRGEAPVVEEDVDVVLRRLQGGDVAQQDEIGTVGALDGFGDL